MALRVVQAPGCRAIYSDADLGLRPGDIVIDTGTIAAALGFDPLSPTANTGLLRVASRLRGLAIKAALEDGISGVVRTSNTKNGQRLLDVTGATKVEVIALSRAEACRRIRKIYPNDRDRAAACELGLDRYFNSVK